MIDRLSLPNVLHFWRMAGAYGPEFMAEVMPERFGWLDEAARQERQRQLEAQIAALKAELRDARS